MRAYRCRIYCTLEALYKRLLLGCELLTIQDCSFQAIRRQVCLHRFFDAMAGMHTDDTTACLAPVVAEEK